MQFLCPICQTPVVPVDLAPDASLVCPRCRVDLKTPSEAIGIYTIPLRGYLSEMGFSQKWHFSIEKNHVS